jgi:nucleotide-binding universal stress UspA family protein
MKSESSPGGAAAIFAYDGSELADYAMAHAATQLDASVEAIVVCVWRPCELGFRPVGTRTLRAAASHEVRRAAEETAEHGARLAESAGFRARSRAVQAVPIWSGLVTAAEEYGCRLIVIGSRWRNERVGRLAGSVAASTSAHFRDEVLSVHRPREWSFRARPSMSALHP